MGKGEERPNMINVTKEELFNMILALQARLDLIEGRPRTEITMTEYRLACYRKDKATMQRYLDQFPIPKGGDHLQPGRESRPAAESHSPAKKVKK